ncbi:erythromycin esterase family protein [Bacillus infantis]|uniref:Erythromycin esterase family protein n=1 Tax=Bacillus infantis TaxID=324767 RepID=A0A5D4R918_9BACI|nr:erythromycin esterase family protein [Bacillus infantis]TYS47875.1 erythromycin esterase family protein [Bacillus infantis]
MFKNNAERIISDIRKHSIRIDDFNDLDAAAEAAGSSQFVLLGEASHGTSEFYTWRAELTKKLIGQYGFKAVCVEGDWPSCFEINSYIKSYNQRLPQDVLKAAFNRWPEWMWANQEIQDFIVWLRNYNEQAKEGSIGFYGLDVYSLWESMEEVIQYLEKDSSNDAEAAKKAFSCFEPYYRNPEDYAVSSGFYGESCEEEVMALQLNIRRNMTKYPPQNEMALNLSVNSLVALHAESYYRSMVKGGSEDWNIRDRHMVSAMEEIIKYYGEDTKVVVWEHNTHIGDARATDMESHGMTNVGQILRERYAGKVFALGLGTYDGTVIAGRSWGERREVMLLPPAAEGSWEDLLHRAGAHNKLILFNSENRSLFQEKIGHRAVGVVYNPEFELNGNYVPSQISDRYDGFLFIDRTSALRPLD